jgi:hypothetical protein
MVDQFGGGHPTKYFEIKWLYKNLKFLQSCADIYPTAQDGSISYGDRFGGLTCDRSQRGSQKSDAKFVVLASQI